MCVVGAAPAVVGAPKRVPLGAPEAAVAAAAAALGAPFRLGLPIPKSAAALVMLLGAPGGGPLGIPLGTSNRAP